MIGLIAICSIVITNGLSILVLNNNHNKEIEVINSEYEKIEEEYQAEILDLKNDIVELKNKEEEKDYKQYTVFNEIELKEGFYEVGKDIPEGKYDIVYAGGTECGNFISENNYDINFLLGTDEYSVEEVKNVTLEIGDTIKILNGIIVRLIPVEE